MAAPTLREGDDRYTPQYNGGAVCRHDSLSDTEDGVPGYRGPSDKGESTEYAAITVTTR